MDFLRKKDESNGLDPKSETIRNLPVGKLSKQRFRRLFSQLPNLRIGDFSEFGI
jgi:hypothetical protein